MAFNRFAEEKIRTAINNGEFENLKGAGKKIDLTDYFSTPAEFRVGYSLLKSQRFIPEEVELLKEVCFLREKLKTDGVDVEKTRIELRDAELALAIALERRKPKRIGPTG